MFILGRSAVQPEAQPRYDQGPAPAGQGCQVPSLLPAARAPRIAATRGEDFGTACDSLDALLLFVPAGAAEQALARLPHGQRLKARLRRSKRAAGAHFCVALPNDRGTLAVVGLVPRSAPAFALLTLAGDMMRAAGSAEPAALGVAARGLGAGETRRAVEAGLAAARAAAFSAPKFSARPQQRASVRNIVAIGARDLDLARAGASADGTDLVRWLTLLPPDRLTPDGYRRLAGRLARDAGLATTFYGERALARLGAGAFLAVTRGSARRDAGILRVRYRPKGRAARQAPVALVGKGICFDTGGTNLKPHKSMLDMHTDMAGSALALATLFALTASRYPRPVDAWLALAETRIGPSAYQPQDVVTALDGTTIQVIHTDAEGRMVLADTLALASRSKPAAIIDCATLTGACVGALTERYSGAFTNRADWRPAIERAGAASGERVWCLPMDEDFDHELESKVADVIQCPVDSKGDHIYAARFLSRFVGKGIPWLHVDLSAATRPGGLAHVPTDVTGFGVRFLLSLLLDHELPAPESK
jgi:leucyl aminopeptidase